MNTHPTSQFHGSHPRLGNNVHHRQRKDIDPQRLGIMQEIHAKHSLLSFLADVINLPTLPSGVAIIPATTTDSANSVTA